MAEGLLRSIAGDSYEPYSAGIDPKGLHPLSVEAMRQIDIDISGQTSKDLNMFLGQQFDYVITVCDRAKQACPVFPGTTTIHWGLDDPAGIQGDRQTQLRAFVRVRDEIASRLQSFVAANLR